MPRSDSADSQSQAIQEEPLPSTSNEEEDPLAGKINCYPALSVIAKNKNYVLNENILHFFVMFHDCRH